MRTRFFVAGSIRLLAALLLLSCSAWAQYAANLQGTVADPSGAAVPQAKVTLVNTVTDVSVTTTTDTTGLYRFLSLAPGSYEISVAAPGFSTAQQTVTLETDQNLSVPTIGLKVGATSESVVVTGQTPILNTTETRDQQLVATQELSSVPLEGRNMLSLSTEAPGRLGTRCRGRVRR